LRLFVFGYGYAARALADRLRPEGWDICATIRRPAEGAKLDVEGVDAVPAGSKRALTQALRGAQAVLVTSPPDALGCPGLRALVPALAAGGAFPDWIGYLSTTGV
jgi:nucleoside-diphosphate-sugar epimerase